MNRYLVLLCLLVPMISTAAEIDEIIGHCAAVEEPSEKLTNGQEEKLKYCFGLIEGIHTISRAIKRTPDIADICFPVAGETNYDYAKTLVAALRAIPEFPRVKGGGVNAAILALKKAYPCNQVKP